MLPSALRPPHGGQEGQQKQPERPSRRLAEQRNALASTCVTPVGAAREQAPASPATECQGVVDNDDLRELCHLPQ